MSVPYADAITLCSNAHPENSNTLCTVQTPLLWKKWHNTFSQSNLLDDFGNIPEGLRNGFSLGCNRQSLKTFIPNNHKSAVTNQGAVEAHISKELMLHRYSGPFNPDRLQQLIGPFQTSPLGVIPKADCKFRIIQDMSYPKDDNPVPAVNSYIKSDDFPCEWSSFSNCFLFVARAPPGTQAAVFDVESAYRIIPVNPSDQTLGCVQFKGLIYIDHCLAFGCASSCGIFGRVADALVAIFKQHGIRAILKWVDDFIFFRSPTSSLPGQQTFPYDKDLIWSVADSLGWPWSRAKHQPFATSFTYLGFLWDINARTVQLPTSKISKYVTHLQPWLSAKSATLIEAQKLLGSLSHCALAVPNGSSHLPQLYKFIAGFSTSKSSFVRHQVSSALHSDLQWWNDQFLHSFCGRGIKEPPPPLLDKVFVDASTSWGIGIVVNSSWSAFRFLPQAFTDGRNIGWAEMLAVELCVVTLTHLYPPNSHIIIHSDNQGVLAAITNQYSRGLHANQSLQRMSHSLLSHDLWITGKYIPSKQNQADSISRGILPVALSRITKAVSIPEPLTDLLVEVIT